jgi:outer membrane protein TolC
VRAAHLTWISDRELIGTLVERERSSRDNYTQVVTEYRQGIAGVSNLEVLVAQNQYLSAHWSWSGRGFRASSTGSSWRIPREGFR